MSQPSVWSVTFFENEAEMTDVLNVVVDALQRSEPRPLLVCIDGPAGSGKTTLANQVAQLVAHSEVIHMDDLYEGWNEPLNDSLIQRVRTHIVVPFHQRRPISFQRWDWHADMWGETVGFPSPEILILEGVGSAARGLREHAQLTIFLDIDDDQGAERVRIRDGAEVAAQLAAWMRHQQTYFESDETRTACDVVVSADV